MGYIKEPDGVDFLIQSNPLTKDQEKQLSDFIVMRKLEIVNQSKKVKRIKKAKQAV